MERVLRANEETAPNPDPFDFVGPDCVTPALVGLGTMRQGSMRLSGCSGFSGFPGFPGFPMNR
jgi:hypothetical protein